MKLPKRFWFYWEMISISQAVSFPLRCFINKTIEKWFHHEITLSWGRGYLQKSLPGLQIQLPAFLNGAAPTTDPRKENRWTWRGSARLDDLLGHRPAVHLAGLFSPTLQSRAAVSSRALKGDESRNKWINKTNPTRICDQMSHCGIGKRVKKRQSCCDGDLRAPKIGS